MYHSTLGLRVIRKKKIYRAVEELEADGALEGPGAFPHAPNLHVNVRNVSQPDAGRASEL